MQFSLIFRLFPFLSKTHHGIIKHGRNDPHASIMEVILQANLVNHIWEQALCIDEACMHSEGVF